MFKGEAARGMPEEKFVRARGLYPMVTDIGQSDQSKTHFSITVLALSSPGQQEEQPKRKK